MLLLFLAQAPAFAECPDRPLAAAITAAAGVEAAFASVDDVAFSAASDALQEALACTRDEIGPGDVVPFHRAMVLVAFYKGDEDKAIASWAAVRSLQPNWVPREALLSTEHPLRRLWDAAAAADSSLLPIQPGRHGCWRVDGIRQDEVPAHRAFIVQGIDERGAIRFTAYHTDSAELVEDERLCANVDEPTPDRALRSARIHRIGTFAAGGLAAGALASLVVSLDAQRELAQIDQANSTADAWRIPHLYARNQAFAAISVGLGVAAAGTATAVWTVHW